VKKYLKTNHGKGNKKGEIGSTPSLPAPLYYTSKAKYRTGLNDDSKIE
jgi:hypothetical protein